MKKFIFSLIATMVAIVSNAQSIEFHQSYSDKSGNAPYANTRIVASNFWSNELGSTNVFTWLAFDENFTNTLVYTEHQFGNSNFYFHPEVRFDYSKYTSTYDFKPMLGFAYLIPTDNSLAVFLTPKLMTTYLYGTGEHSWSDPDLQFSINSSYETEKVYYEGYIDTNWFDVVSVFAEQKAYYKVSQNYHVGASIVFTAGKDMDTFCQPYLSFKVSL